MFLYILVQTQPRLGLRVQNICVYILQTGLMRKLREFKDDLVITNICMLVVRRVCNTLQERQLVHSPLSQGVLAPS